MKMCFLINLVQSSGAHELVVINLQKVIVRPLGKITILIRRPIFKSMTAAPAFVCDCPNNHVPLVSDDQWPTITND